MSILQKYEKIRLVDIMLIMLIVVCPLPRAYTMYNFMSGPENRPFGNTLGITIPLLFFILMYFITIGKNNFYIYYKSPLNYFFFFAVISFFFPIQGRIWQITLIGIFKLLIIWGLYDILLKKFSFANYEKCLDWGLSIGLLIESALGFLYVFAHVSIPYVSIGFPYDRNGFSRMTGAMAHPGDFSLYISIIYFYYICKLLFKKDKKSIKYIILSLVDLVLSGARAMIITSILISVIIFWKKYQRNWIVKLVIMSGIIIASIGVYHSSFYQNLFMEENFFETITARLIHWRIGFQIMFSSFNNFLFGVGLNNHVDYIASHFSTLSYLITDTSVVDAFFIQNNPIHNSLLVVGTELGIVGLFLYISIYIVGIINAWKILKAYPKYKSQCTYVIGCLFIFLLYSFQGWALMKDMGWVLFILVNAFLYSIKKDAKKLNKKE
ncbi:MAG: O-antigen ligase family protein [Sporolactobacillus sp.]|jgi:O-antigen ligase|nr:O-antigen ligase family protein [Sporolactobacillus sp.]